MNFKQDRDNELINKFKNKKYKVFKIDTLELLVGRLRKKEKSLTKIKKEEDLSKMKERVLRLKNFFDELSTTKT